MNPEEKLEALISSSNATTGISDDTITEAMQSLCDGYMQGDAPAYPDEYVTDGLTAWYDAINNTRSGHDASATTWEDLSGNGYDLKLSLGNAPIVGNNFMYFYGGRLTSDSAPTRTDADYPVYAELVMQIIDKTGTKFIVGLPSTGFGTFWCGKTTLSAQHIANNTSGITTSTTPDKKSSFWLLAKAYLGEDTDFSENTSTNGGWASTVNISMGTYTGLSSYLFKGYVLAYRLYNRNLSMSEILQNYHQDKKRFGLGGAPFGLEELFTALPQLPTGTSKTLSVSSAQLAEASAETIAIATGKGWTIA